jgi:hypothetical protein
MTTQAPRTLADYKAAWEDFRIECENLDRARRAAARGYLNEDLDADWDDACDRVDDFEALYAHEPVWQRADRLMDQYYARADI